MTTTKTCPGMNEREITGPKTQKNGITGKNTGKEEEGKRGSSLSVSHTKGVGHSALLLLLLLLFFCLFYFICSFFFIFPSACFRLVVVVVVVVVVNVAALLSILVFTFT